MPNPRVMVTGIGVISALGVGVERHWSRLQRGESGVGASAGPLYERTPHPQAGAEAYDRRTLVPDRMLRKLLSASASLPHVAASEAMESANLTGREDLTLRCGLYVGSIGVDINLDDFIPAVRESLDTNQVFDLSRFGKRGMRLLDPLFLVKALPNAGLCGVSIQHRIFGPNANITNGTVSGLQAVAMAAAAIRRGEITLALAGGYDSLVRMDEVVQHTLDGRLSHRASEPERACRAFDLERDGFPPGEGAAFVVLEAEAHARARHARAFGEVLAISQTTDAQQFGRPPMDAALNGNGQGDGVALAQAARQTLRIAGCAPADLGAIYLDGLATEADDLREAHAVRQVVGDRPVPCTAATAAVGFTGAASGTFSLAHALLGLTDQVIPPLLNCNQPDPRCQITIARTARAEPHDRALVWNSDQGVKNIAVLLGRVPS